MRTSALILLSLAMAAPFATAQNQSPAAPEAQTKPAAPSASTSADSTSSSAKPVEVDIKIKDQSAATAVKSGKDSSGHDTISVDFPDEDVRGIVRNVADLFELNVVIPEALQGKTTVKLRDVTWRQIFQVVLTPAGFTYMEDGNIIKVVSLESLQAEPVTTEVFILNYAKAGEIMPSVASLVEAGVGGKIVVDARSNALVITERPSRLTRVRPIIESLDRSTDQVMIESKFIEITNVNGRNLGVKWGSLDGTTVSAGSLQNSYTKDRGSSSSNSSGSTSAGHGTTSDNAGTNASVSSDGTSSVTSAVASSVAATSQTAINAATSLLHSGASTSSTTAVFSATDFSAVLAALDTFTDLKVVSNPTVVTLNNTEAMINVGKEYPIPNYTYNQDRGTFEVSGFTYRPIGIILRVTPQVNSRGFIKLSVEPEVSSSNANASFGTASIPIIESRKTKTQVSMSDGYTMGIGGLISLDSSDTTTKVPFLGDIPLIGNLFKHKSKSSTRKNLVIFITAKIMNAEGGRIEQIYDPRQIRDMKLNKGDLPGYRETTSAFQPMPAPLPEKGSGKAAVKAPSSSVSDSTTSQNDKPFFRRGTSDAKDAQTK